MLKKARRWIFEKGWALTSKKYEILNAKSFTPSHSAFSTRLAKFGFNFFSMFVPDLMHEFELSVWKVIFTHLLRILYAAGGDKIQEFNRRFRMVPTFGCDIIQRFSRNISGMKKLAARDFEDMLQCIIPIIKGLLPKNHDKIVADMLFELVNWHAHAKLHIHMDWTLKIFEKATVSLSAAVCQFRRTTCNAFVTRELPKEEAARGHRTAAMAMKGAKVKGKGKAGQKIKKLNMETYKYHSLGDYPRTIQIYGTTDNYTTQVGKLEHRRVKRFYARTNKIKFAFQIARHQQHEAIIQSIKRREEESR
ncbi:hypothetical protein SCP_1200600 [Sparassis crispa]|uniref:Uncharacterized protein n=1 Tax=Sparassis crispa TaxID=139825 RepID=A0A401H084_9APHY|nr:hypothetical protein SCP_1200600 [Sparassis crispa]GBE87835.1 hypothetical protein SCP_1200600 [Sparassis crispa]